MPVFYSPQGNIDENAPNGRPYTHTDRMLADIVAFAGPKW
jgi:hypothetical protein